VTDVVVIGGGIIGLLCARELRTAGLAVTLVERDQPGQQASWASAGILSVEPAGEDSPHATLKRHSRQLYPTLVAELRDESGIDPEMTWEGHLVPAFSEAQARDLAQWTAYEARGGLETELLQGAALRSAEPALGPAVVAAQLRPGGQLDNRRLCRALDLANRRLGVEVLVGAAVSQILVRAGRAVGVRTLEGDLPASAVVVAAGSWSAAISGSAPLPPVAPQRGEILALDQVAVGLRRVVVKPGDPYLAPRADGRLIVGATRQYVGYNSSYTAAGVAWLLNGALEMVPALAQTPIAEIWTGFRPISGDGVPIIGRGALEGLFFATGHGPSGIVPAPASARLLAALLLGQQPPFSPEPFDPRRFEHLTISPDPRTWAIRGGHQV
jgi:glycine oxidase